MIEEGADTSALENALGGMFEAPPKPEPVKVDPLPDTPAGDEAQADEIMQAEGEEKPEAKAEEAPGEPEFEIEVDGAREVVKGKDQIKELLQKGAHYTKNSEQNARIRDALVAQAQSLKDLGEFQTAIVTDLAELRQIDARLEEFSKIDWSTAIDSDFTQAMKLQEQRNQLREMRQTKIDQLNQKHSLHQQNQAKAVQQMREAEFATLLAKLPEWRNSEKAQAEQRSIAKNLTYYGYNEAEIDSLMDHRAVLVARDAVKWRELQASKSGQLKQVRDAPPVSRPGATTPTDNGRTDFNKARQELRRLGQKGKSHAQEALVTKMLDRAFK